MKLLNGKRVSCCLALALAVGCGGGSTDTPSKPSKASGDAKPSTGASSGAKGKVEKTGLDVVAKGTLKGKVTFDGDVPAPRDMKPLMTKDTDHCTKADPKNDLKDPLWIVSPTKEVKNVVVFLRAPEGKYFNLPADKTKVTAAKVMDQPFCMFEPHVVTLFPSYFDGKKQIRTGEKFEVKNSAPLVHNTSYATSDSLLGVQNNVRLSAGEHIDIVAKPSRDTVAGGEQVISIKCDIHPWMGAKAFVLDHPYSAITKEDGTYEIKNAPEGVELPLMYWHESFGDKPRELKKVTITGDTTENITLKK